LINLFLNSFKSDDKERQKEFDFCIEKNIENPFIDKIYFLKSTKENSIFNRPTYSDFFREMAKFPSDINIIANSDIYFDETVQLADRIQGREVWCLTRWEKMKRFDEKLQKEVDVIMYFNRRNPFDEPKWSQDAWVVRGGPNIEANFGLGIAGCDNKIAYLFRGAGYNVRNPSYSIRAIHVHEKPTIRTNYVVPRPYLHIEPHNL